MPIFRHSRPLHLTVCLLALALPGWSANPEVILDHLTLRPPVPGASAPRQVTLTLDGWATAAQPTEPHGLTLTYVDDPIAVGVFRIHRPAGGFEWQFSNAASTSLPEDRLAMELTDDHVLIVKARGDDTGALDIRLQPGINGGVFVGENKLVSAGDIPASLRLSGGSLLPVGGNAPGFIAGGPGSHAVGLTTIALGTNANAYGDHALALGSESYAYLTGVALGYGAKSYGIGSLALGQTSSVYHHYATAIGCAQAYGYYSTAINSQAHGESSFAASWGQSWGYASVAFGAYAAGYKSFAANSGTTYGEYSTAIGRGTYTAQPNQTALGSYNLMPVAGSTPLPTDPLFMLGNGWVEEPAGQPVIEHRQNALTVAYNGNTEIQGNLTVTGGQEGDTHPATVFQRDVSVKGVLRVKPAGDLSMGAFAVGTQP